MDNLIDEYLKQITETKDIEIPFIEINDSNEDLVRHVRAIFSIIVDLYGAERMVLKASKAEAINLLRSDKLPERILALQKIIYEDKELKEVPLEEDLPEILENLEDILSDALARRSIEEKIEAKISERLQKQQDEYIKEIKKEILTENSSIENARTLKKLAILEKKNTESLTVSAMELLRPQQLGEVIGQEDAIKSLMSKMAAPFPQHILLYGPPGVGKTTVARLALEASKKIKGSVFKKKAPFIEVNGATLRWDPRDVTNPLLGSVHDPIYQGARKDFAETGIPEPKLGLVSDAHGGILFIDEIGEMDPLLLNKLLKVLEDKRVFYDSSYYDPDDKKIPQYIHKIFKEGAPADFVLIGATTRQPYELNSALRSRCAEVYFEPLSPKNIREIVENSAEKLDIILEDEVADIISHHTIEGRKANNILTDAYGFALYNQKLKKGRPPKYLKVTKEHLYSVIQSSRISSFVNTKASDSNEIGHVFGLGVSGFVGSVLEIEAVSFPVKNKGKGTIRFNETAGSMARDSVFNAASVIRKLTGKEVTDFDFHVNVVGGGNIDGPSAGLAIFVALLSAMHDVSIFQNVAMTGEISIQGKVKPVGGIPEKIYGARQAGMKKVLIPWENYKDTPGNIEGIEVVFVENISEALKHLIAEEKLHLIKNVC